MEITHAYAAGLIDGEGTVTITTKNASSRFRVPIVSVSSTTYELLQFLQDNYQGHISTQKIRKEHFKPSWSWKLSYNATLDFLEKVLPYMKEPTKIYRAKLLLDEYKLVTPRNGKYTDEMVQAKLAFEHKFFHPSDTIAKP